MVVSETKIEDLFPDSHFYIKGFRMFRKDRNRFGGGLLIYTRRGFIIHRINDLEGNNVESISLLVRSNNSSKGITSRERCRDNQVNVPWDITEPCSWTLVLRGCFPDVTYWVELLVKRLPIVIYSPASGQEFQGRKGLIGCYGWVQLVKFNSTAHKTNFHIKHAYRCNSYE